MATEVAKLKKYKNTNEWRFRLMNNEVLPNDYKETLELIIDKIKIAQQNAVISANYYLLNLYWEIGNIIVDKKKKQGWGTGVIEIYQKI